MPPSACSKGVSNGEPLPWHRAHTLHPRPGIPSPQTPPHFQLPGLAWALSLPPPASASLSSSWLPPSRIPPDRGGPRAVLCTAQDPLLFFPTPRGRLVP